MQKNDINIAFVNLWCVKNLVDTQYLIWKIFSYDIRNKKHKLNFVSDPYDKNVDIIFVNTCWFLSSARQEMIETIQDLLQRTRAKIYVWGCGIRYSKSLRSPQKVREEVQKNSDKFFQIFSDRNLLDFPRVYFLSWQDIDTISIDQLLRWYNSTDFWDFVFPKQKVRAYTNAIYKYEYLKIAEWCNNSCSFCIIPKIRWKQKSLPLEEILQEAENMIKSGIEEIILIAQDTTRYWIDLYWKPMLWKLLEELENMPYDFRYRILYLYPDIVSLKQLEKLKNFRKFIPYFDIPLQHISSAVLKSMGRFYDTNYIYKFLDFINTNWSEKFIRTNFIVGFPGETEEDFKQLIDFVKKWYFDNIAIFEYHDEPLAASSKLDWKLSGDVIRQRFQILKQVIDEILEKKQKQRRWKEFVGYVMDIIYGKSDKAFWENLKKLFSNSPNIFSDFPRIIVRPYLHAPEIDFYDEVSLEQIEAIYGDKEYIDIGDKIIYKLK